MLGSTPELAELHHEVILSYYSRSVKQTFVPLLSVIAAMTVVLYSNGQDKTVFIWLTVMLLSQIPRMYIGFKVTDKAFGTVKKRMRMARLAALITGLTMGSVCWYAPDLTVESRSLITLIFAGISASSIATSLGYKPIYLNASGVFLISALIIWSIDPNGLVSVWIKVLVILLVLLLSAMLYGLISVVYRFFVRNLQVQEQLKATLNAERSANTAKTRFLAAASHDLRQPLHAMSLFSAALVARPLDAKSQSLAVRMNDSMKELTEELDALLDISKLDANMVPVKAKAANLTDVVIGVVEAQRPAAAAKGLAMNVDLQDNINIQTDVDLVRRILRNLIDNAIKYTDKGYISCSLWQDDEGIRLLIEDSGVGISKDQQPHIWEEFYQVDNPARDRQLGLGLGLSVVSRLADLLEIKVALISSDSNGSCFELRIPESISQMTGTPDAVALQSIGETGFLDGQKILVVDDDKSIRLSTESLLSSLGMEVLLAANTNEAVSLYDKTRVKCALIDLRLEGGDDGIDTITRLRKIDPIVTPIIITGDTAPERVAEANSLGCTWLVKPVSQKSLISELRSIYC